MSGHLPILLCCLSIIGLQVLVNSSLMYSHLFDPVHTIKGLLIINITKCGSKLLSLLDTQSCNRVSGSLRPLSETSNILIFTQVCLSCQNLQDNFDARGMHQKLEEHSTEVHNSRRPLDRLANPNRNPNPNLDLWPNRLFIGGRGIVMDYHKFGDFSFSCFGFIVRTDRQNHTQTRMIAILTRLPSAWVMNGSNEMKRDADARRSKQLVISKEEDETVDWWRQRRGTSATPTRGAEQDQYIGRLGSRLLCVWSRPTEAYIYVHW